MSDKIIYTYTDSEGNPLYRQVRVQGKDGKSFYSESFINNKWVKGLKNVNRVLYNLPMVLQAIKNKQKIYFVEGEKDVDTLTKKGLVATTIARRS